ncbi:C-type lectin-like precursor [Aphelenchoides avenae]|nr:C-type lectin-like precursor [Aphelenchus avenae]
MIRPLGQTWAGWSTAKKVAVAGVAFLAVGAVLLSVFFLLTSRNALCPSGWYERARRCFKFTEPLTFDDAVERCKQLGGQPASVRSAPENMALFELSRKELPQHERYYIGLYLPMLDNARHTWLDGTGSLYRNWDQGKQLLMDAHQCTEVTLGTEGRWRGVVCYQEQPLLCSVPVKNP